MATVTIQNQILDVNQLNAQLRTIQQGDILKLENCTLTQTMAGSLFVASRIPVNVDLEFEKTTFEGQHYFQQERNGRLVFSNCTLKGHRLTISKSIDGYISFLGLTKIGRGITLEDCEGVSLYIPTDAEFEPHPEWWLPAEHACRMKKSVDILIRQSTGGASIKGSNVPLMFQAMNCELTGLEIDVNSIENFELIQSEVKNLSLNWNTIERIAVFSTTIIYSSIPIPKLLAVPLFLQHVESGMNWPTLETFAQTAKRNGDLSGFVKLFARAGESKAFRVQKSLLKELGELDWDNPKRKMVLIWSLISNFLMNLLVNRWFKRFYSPSKVFFTQLFTVFGFTYIYWYSKELLVVGSTSNPISTRIEALYFSSVTFLTIGYGDIIPKGWLQLAASVEGFLGLVLGLILAVVASRRYSS